MKGILTILAFLIIAASLPMMIPCDNKVYAVSGCCKERSSYKARWYKNGKNFKACKSLNQKDKDKVFDQLGLVWWDTQCR